MRLHSRSAILNDDKGTIGLTIAFRNGKVLVLETGNATIEESVERGKAFAVVELGDYIILFS